MIKKIDFYTSIIVSSFLAILGTGIIFFMIFVPVIQTGGIITIDTNSHGEMWFEFCLVLFVFIIAILTTIINLVKIVREIKER